MRTVTYRLVDLQKATITIGKVGENEHTRVQFACKKAFDEYPSAIPALTVTNPSGTSYPVVTTRDGEYVIWDVADSDLTAQGNGELQLTFTENGVVCKSYIAKTKVKRSIVANGTAPDPVQNWLDTAAEVLESVNEAIPAGGTAGQVLAKKSNADRDLEWVNQTGGGGGTDNYNALSNKPKINGYTLYGDVTLQNIGALSADALAGAIATALAQAKASGEFDGADGQDGADGVGIASIAKTGTSGLVDTYTITLTSGSTYTFTVTNGKDGVDGQDGAPGQDGQDGDDGQDGFSPTVTVTTITGGHRVVITDAQGAHTFDVMDGQGGSVTVDDELSNSSTNPVQNKAITGAVEELTEAIMTKAGTETTTESGVDLDISDENGNVLVELKNGHIKTKYFDSSASGNSGIIARNSDVTDGVYASCRYHQPSASSKQFCILMGADFHSDATRLTSMVEYLNAIDAFDAGICLGDIGSWEKDATFYTTAISNTQKPFLTVIGNHDAAEGNTLSKAYTNISDLVAKFITPNIQYADLASGEYTSGKSYYYKDFSTYGIRLIVLNNYEYPTDNDGTNFLYHHGWECWSQDQVDWFISTLNNTPTTYGVIVAAHFVPTSMAMDKTGIWTSATMQYNSWSPDTTLISADKSMLAEIVDAWIDGSTLSKTYSFDVTGGTWSGITVSADFSSRGSGEFIAWIGGHLHMSLLGTIYGYTDQHVYLADCSGVGSSLQGDTPRKVGTRSEDALCVLSVDRTNKTVKLLRIGAHFTMEGVDRLYGKFSYAGS